MSPSPIGPDRETSRTPSCCKDPPPLVFLAAPASSSMTKHVAALTIVLALLPSQAHAQRLLDPITNVAAEYRTSKGAEWINGNYRVSLGVQGGQIVEVRIVKADARPGIGIAPNLAMQFAPSGLGPTASRTFPQTSGPLVSTRAWEWDYGDYVVGLQEDTYLRDNPSVGVRAGDLSSHRWSVRGRPRPTPQFCAMAVGKQADGGFLPSPSGPYGDAESARRGAMQPLEARGFNWTNTEVEVSPNGAVALAVFYTRDGRLTYSLHKSENVPFAVGQALSSSWQNGDRRRKMRVWWVRCGTSPQTSAQELAEHAPLNVRIDQYGGSFETADLTAPPPPPPPPQFTGLAGYWNVSDGSRVSVLYYGDRTYKANYIDANGQVLGPAFVISMPPDKPGRYQGTLWDSGNMHANSVFTVTQDVVTVQVPAGGGLTFSRTR